MTPAECFAFKLCLAFGDDNIHPDYLLPRLTAQQFMDWQTYDAQEPWGEFRQDLRGVAHVLALTGNGQDIELMHPYFREGELMWERHKELAAKSDSPEHKAKLKAAREKHLAETKKRGA